MMLRPLSLLRVREAWGARGLRIAAASDHAGVSLKADLVNWLRDARSHDVDDQGPFDANTSVDYTGYAESVSAAVASGEADLGLLICGTGVGMSMAANKSAAAVRAAAVSDTFSARETRRHNDCNVLCLGQRVVGAGLAQDIVAAWLDAEFEGGRHARRVEHIGRRMRELEALET